MAGIEVSFVGMCLSSVMGKKSAYSKFITQPEPGKQASEFQVSSGDSVAPEDCWKLAEWKLQGFQPISGVSADGKAYAYFKAEKISGKLVKGG